MYGYKDNPAFVVNEICGIIKTDKKSRMIMAAKKEYEYKGLQNATP
jgi:hypothetical protein